jgi:hypothetical protein
MVLLFSTILFCIGCCSLHTGSTWSEETTLNNSLLAGTYVVNSTLLNYNATDGSYSYNSTWVLEQMNQTKTENQ